MAAHDPVEVTVESAPQRWGENLTRRKERERARLAASTPRTLSKADFLLGVRDDTRQGAIRFRQPGDGSYYSAHRNAVPRPRSPTRPGG